MKMIKKLFLFATLFLFSCSVFSEVVSDNYCFVSGTDKPIRFELRRYTDMSSKWKGGYVKYANSKSPISLVFKNAQEEVISKDQPSQVTTTWLEISNNKISGEYEMMSQGGNIYSMKYTNFAKHKEYHFLFDPEIEASLLTGCKW